VEPEWIFHFLVMNIWVRPTLSFREAAELYLTRQSLRKKDDVMKGNRNKISHRELSQLITFLTRMMEVGLSTQSVIRVLRNMDGGKALRAANERITERIENGGSLSDGMAQSPAAFDGLYISLIQAGEMSGRLPEALTRVKAHLERAHALRRKLSAALIYPLCVISTAALVSSLLVIFIIPSFKELFSDLETPLPWLTRMVIELSETSVRWAPCFLIVLSSLCFIISRFFATPRGREVLDRYLLRAPLIGDSIKKSALARFCRTFSTTLDAGMPILSALEASAQAAGNRVIQQKFVKACSDISEGIEISQSLNASKLFSSTSIEMLELGERTGSVVTMLENIAEDLEEGVAHSLDTAMRMAEPAMVVILGAVVGTLVIAMYLPILSMGDLLS
jgi:type IV pilus assembly protein PilC